MFLDKEFASGFESATFASAKSSKKNWTNQEGFLPVQRSGALRGENLAETRFFDLWAGSEKLLVSFRNNLSGVFNTAFYISREKLSDKSVFFKKN